MLWDPSKPWPPFSGVSFSSGAPEIMVELVNWYKLVVQQQITQPTSRLVRTNCNTWVTLGEPEAAGNSGMIHLYIKLLGPCVTAKTRHRSYDAPFGESNWKISYTTLLRWLILRHCLWHSVTHYHFLEPSSNKASCSWSSCRKFRRFSLQGWI